MSISQLDNDLGFISALDDEPNDEGGLTAAQLKAKFDEAGNTIKDYINDTLIPGIEDEVDTKVAAAELHSGNVPLGGAAGQVLTKQSGSDYDAVWAAPDTTKAAHALTLAEKNLINILQLKLQQSLSETDIDAWCDLLDDDSLIDADSSSSHTVYSGELIVDVGGIDFLGGTATEDTAVGEKSWANHENALVDDTTYAIFSAGSTYASKYSYYLKIQDFGFNVPSTATISGAAVSIRRYAAYGSASIPAYGRDTYLKLVGADGTPQGTSHADTSTLYGTTAETVVYGGATDTWGLTLTPDIVNDADFGVALSCYICSYSSGNTIFLECIKMALYYDDGDATVVWSAMTASEALEKMAVVAEQNEGATGSITWYLSEDCANLTQVTALDTMQATSFTGTSVYLKCVLTGDASVDAVAYGGY